MLINPLNCLHALRAMSYLKALLHIDLQTILVRMKAHVCIYTGILYSATDDGQ